MTTKIDTTVPMPAVPRQFALVLDEDDPDYGEYVAACQPDSRVVWWGCMVDGRALLYRFGEDGTLDTARSQDAELAEERWSQLYPVKLTWL